MNIHEFVKEFQNMLEEFGGAWIDLHEKEPDKYPLELSPGDWMEQMFSYYEGIKL